MEESPVLKIEQGCCQQCGCDVGTQIPNQKPYWQVDLRYHYSYAFGDRTLSDERFPGVLKAYFKYLDAPPSVVGVRKPKNPLFY
ncbi:hypothetical protein CONPUDRAFT_166257 [Coniophora puteana RWD-64-598 SS2]|uniref:Uncharacterized protein n=1 Tax=Coniophora puteana (strain RWD-64-598) TaxID=741705 RepID=A0A5M3MLD4_CONPW|nr:uncharacterized protein CONPUDRAFT_166257 [Coniophora puteana RWD-64-598 SS2]EIW79485.1 hypothetical protein CONPUDRAFT_166257 [Coniophora puteana RWD-64-598 SS2]